MSQQAACSFDKSDSYKWMKAYIKNYEIYFSILPPSGHPQITWHLYSSPLYTFQIDADNPQPCWLHVRVTTIEREKKERRWTIKQNENKKEMKNTYSNTPIGALLPSSCHMLSLNFLSLNIFLNFSFDELGHNVVTFSTVCSTGNNQVHGAI